MGWSCGESQPHRRHLLLLLFAGSWNLLRYYLLRYFRPEEWHCGRLAPHSNNEIFESNLCDENEISSANSEKFSQVQLTISPLNFIFIFYHFGGLQPKKKMEHMTDILKAVLRETFAKENERPGVHLFTPSITVCFVQEEKNKYELKVSIGSSIISEQQGPNHVGGRTSFDQDGKINNMPQDLDKISSSDMQESTTCIVSPSSGSPVLQCDESCLSHGSISPIQFCHSTERLFESPHGKSVVESAVLKAGDASPLLDQASIASLPKRDKKQIPKPGSTISFCFADTGMVLMFFASRSGIK